VSETGFSVFQFHFTLKIEHFPRASLNFDLQTGSRCHLLVCSPSQQSVLRLQALQSVAQNIVLRIRALYNSYPWLYIAFGRSQVLRPFQLQVLQGLKDSTVDQRLKCIDNHYRFIPNSHCATRRDKTVSSGRFGWCELGVIFHVEMRSFEIPANHEHRVKWKTVRTVSLYSYAAGWIICCYSFTTCRMPLVIVPPFW